MPRLLIVSYLLKKSILYIEKKYRYTYIYGEILRKIPHGKEPVMFRLWVKIFKDNRMLKDTVICDDSDDTRTHKIFHALEEACYEFDLSKPIWLDSTVAEFRRHSKARFYQDNFIESIEFDYMEIHVIEEG